MRTVAKTWFHILRRSSTDLIHWTCSNDYLRDGDTILAELHIFILEIFFYIFGVFQEIDFYLGTEDFLQDKSQIEKDTFLFRLSTCLMRCDLSGFLSSLFLDVE